MGRIICAPDMPVEAQKHLGIFDKRSFAARQARLNDAQPWTGTLTRTQHACLS
jgi:hypothetical protein